MTVAPSADIDSIALPPGVVDGLVGSALLRLNDRALVDRVNGERLFRERVERMAQHVAIALVCAQSFEHDADFELALARRPFAEGDSQVGEIASVIVNLAEIEAAGFDVGVDRAQLAARIVLIRGAI